MGSTGVLSKCVRCRLEVRVVDGAPDRCPRCGADLDDLALYVSRQQLVKAVLDAEEQVLRRLQTALEGAAPDVQPAGLVTQAPGSAGIVVRARRVSPHGWLALLTTVVARVVRHLDERDAVELLGHQPRVGRARSGDLLTHQERANVDHEVRRIRQEQLRRLPEREPFGIG